MKLEKSEAIVLKTIKMGESSQILTVYSKEFGKLKLIAKASRSPKSRIAALTEKFCVVQIVFYKKENKELYFLSSLDGIMFFPGLAQDLTRLAYASACVELLDNLVFSEEPAYSIYTLLKKCLQDIENFPAESLPWFYFAYALKLTGLLGYSPNLGACVSCNAIREQKTYFFSLEKGGIVCSACLEKEKLYLKISSEALGIMRKMQTDSFDNLKILKVDGSRLKEIGAVMNSFLEYHSGSKKLKSLEFLEKLHTSEKRSRIAQTS